MNAIIALSLLYATIMLVYIAFARLIINGVRQPLNARLPKLKHNIVFLTDTEVVRGRGRRFIAFCSSEGTKYYNL